MNRSRRCSRPVRPRRAEPGVLEDEADGSGPQRAAHILVQVEGGDDDHLQRAGARGLGTVRGLADDGVSYHPADRFWAFQWRGMAIYLMLALALAGVSAWGCRCL
ncbi:hypothetical protein [Streptomyces milbemycinicus]|uniref:hypothetical protein n=1 Tax=Streptomyces milbemycinicus TaxID=476552 RepID=UPI003F4D6473